MKILCVWGAFFPLAKLYQKQLLSGSKSGTLMFCVIVNCLLQFLAVILSFQHGILTMAWFYVCVNILCILMLHYFVKKINGVSLKNLFFNILPFLSAAVLAVLTAGILSYPISNIYFRAITKILISGGLYLLILKLAKSETLSQSLDFLKDFLQKKKK